MFKEILKILPRLDTGDLNKMERDLSKRFKKVAKGFGKGLGASLLGGGLAGAALGIIDKLLNPLKEVQESIDRVLGEGDDLVTYAKQFDTTSGKLLKLQALAMANGLDKEALFMLMGKFQTAVAEAQADPTKQTSVRRFANVKDTGEGFFNYIQALQTLGKTDKGAQIRAQQEVFGEKQILKMSDFLNADFKQLISSLKLMGSEYYTPRVNKLGQLNDLQDEKGASRYANDIFNKGGTINKGMIESRDRQLKIELERENQRIASYKSLAIMAETSGKLLKLLEEGYLEVAKIATSSSSINEFILKYSSSRAFRGVTPKGE